MGTTQSTYANIDGDIIVYRSGFAAEKTHYVLTWDDGGLTQEFIGKKELNAFIKENELTGYEVESRLEVEPLSHALATVKSTIATIINSTKPEDIKVYLTKGDNFRHELATIAKYKGNRDNLRRPHHYSDIREYLIKYYSAIVCEGYEADDALADAQTENTVLCSIDKDLLQVPGKHYNWVTDTKLLVTPETGLLKLWCQVLTGDKTDNIPGIYKCGPVTAKKLLADCTTEEEMWDVCVEKWEEHILGDTPPTWMSLKDDETKSVTYPHWEGDSMETVNIEHIVEEIYQLIKVGRR